jgi:hypothetical protein
MLLRTILDVPIAVVVKQAGVSSDEKRAGTTGGIKDF